MSAAENKAVFLSYASQDAEAAKKICDALRAAGVEVWFDQNELVGGDAWDAKIRKQIAECALFVPLISAATQARREGYFRLEWRIAAQRTHMMSEQIAFLLPVVIDATRDTDADVPGEFKAVQWTRLPAGDSSERFCARVKKLIGGTELETGRPRPAERDEGVASPVKQTPARSWALPAIIGAALLIAVAAYFSLRPRRSPEEIAKLIASAQTIAANAAAKSTPMPAATPQTEAQKLVVRAHQLRSLNEVSREKLDAAGDQVDRALKLDSSDADVWAMGAQIDALMVYQGYDISDERRQAAAKRAARAAALAAAAFETRHAQAMVAGFMVQSVESGAEAETVYRGLLKERPDDVELLEEFGTVLRNRRRFDEAAAVFVQAQRPLLAGRAYFYAGQFGDAGKMADQILAEKREVAALVLKGEVELFGFNDREAAQATVDRFTSTELMGDDAASIALRLAVLRQDSARLLKLLEPFTHPFISIVGVNYPRQYWTGLARSWSSQEEAAKVELRGALQSVEERLKSKPNDPESVGWAALLHARLGENAEAERLLRLYCNYHNYTPAPVSFDFWYALTRLAQRGHDDEVVAMLDKTFRGPPGIFRAITYAWARFSPEFNPLRGNPRFEQLLRETLPKGAKPFDDPKVAPDQKSVAVLAFANLSDDKGNEYFSDGISEELLNMLARVPGLKVTARTSSFHFKGKDTPISEIAQQLGVAYVVEGSVRKSGDKVRITAQLIRADDGFRVWASDDLDRELKDIFAVQDEIAGLIAKNLSLKLGASSAVATAAVNPQAFELYVQGRQAWNLRNAEGFARAEQLLHRAIELAPDFARAHTALADVVLLRAVYGYSIGLFSQRDSPELARIAAEIRRVLALDPDLAEAHASLGLALMHGWKFDEAERELRRAIALNPNYATAHHWLGLALFMAGQIDEALAETNLSAELDPLSPAVLGNAGWALRGVGRYREAVAVLDRALALQPSSQVWRADKALALVGLGRSAEAIALARQLPAGEPDTIACQIAVFGQSGLKAEAEALLPQLKAKCSWPMSYVLLAAGHREEALAALDASSTLGSDDCLVIFCSPLYDAIRDDPRFAKFLATLGWTEAHARAQAWRNAHPPEKPETKK